MLAMLLACSSRTRAPTRPSLVHASASSSPRRSFKRNTHPPARSPSAGDNGSPSVSTHCLSLTQACKPFPSTCPKRATIFTPPLPQVTRLSSTGSLVGAPQLALASHTLSAALLFCPGFLFAVRPSPFPPRSQLLHSRATPSSTRLVRLDSCVSAAALPRALFRRSVQPLVTRSI